MPREQNEPNILMSSFHHYLLQAYRDHSISLVQHIFLILLTIQVFPKMSTNYHLYLLLYAMN